MSANKAVEYGKLLPVKFLVVGEVMKGAKYWITAQLVEVGPGIIRSPRKVSAENYLELEEKVPLLGKLLCMTDAEYDKWQAEQEAQAPKGSAAPAPPSPKPQPTAGKEEGKEPGASTQSAMLSPAQRKKLLALARNVIEAAVKGEPLSETNLTDAAAKLGVAREPALLEHCGAFVTIKNHGELRGCIGNFVAHEPLYRVVQKMAYASSTQDSRFFGNQLTSKELRDIDIEISVLSPLQPIADPMKIELGKHGIYIINEKLNRGGCFLPQVATETGWTKEEFLSHCARDKAGLGADAWKNDPDTKVLVFTAEVFGEKE
jgi:AmmeMemoRadiSam system protein A